MDMFSILLDLYLELQSHVVTLTFLRSAKFFSTADATFYSNNSNVQGFQFLHILANICHFPFFDSSHSNGCVVVSHVVFLFVCFLKHFDSF